MGLIQWLKGGEAERTVEGSTRASAPGGASELLLRFIDKGEVGRGGMSSVRRVIDKNVLREVAMKVLDPERAKSTSAVQEFVEEAQITGQLDHPNIVPIHELGIDEQGTKYFTMKLVRGHTLTKWVRASSSDRGTPSYLTELLQIFLKVCDALAFAHSKGVVHRDLKPDNIMIGSFGEVYVMDWGLAHILHREGGGRPGGVTVSTMGRSIAKDKLAGTPAYMAPEQALGQLDEVDDRTDVFALGAVLYFILTGKHPYAGYGIEEAIRRAKVCEFVPPELAAADVALPMSICSICKHAMSASKSDRYQSVLDLKSDVQRFLAGGMHLSTRTVAPGTPIVIEGEAGDAAYIITRGNCVAYKSIDGQRRVLREMGPGSVFGETAVISGEPRSATVEAVDEVVVAVVTRHMLEEGLGMDSWLGLFVRALADRFRDVDARLTAAERFINEQHRAGQ